MRKQAIFSPEIFLLLQYTLYTCTRTLLLIQLQFELLRAQKCKLGWKERLILESGKKRLSLSKEPNLKKNAKFCISKNVRFFILHFQGAVCSWFFQFCNFYANLAPYLRLVRLGKWRIFFCLRPIYYKLYYQSKTRIIITWYTL